MTVNLETDVAQRIVAALAAATGSDDVRKQLDLPLYDLGLLDSFTTVNLMLELEAAFGLELSPADVDRAAWATPRLFIADITRRLAART